MPTGGSLVPIYAQNGLPFDVSAVKSNGTQYLLKDVTYREIDASHGIFESSLYLRNGDNIVQLSGPQSADFVLGAYAAAWTEIAGSNYGLQVFDILTGLTHSLAIDAPTFQLLDINDRYVLVTSEVIPEPASLLLFGSAGLIFISTRQGIFARRKG